MMSQVIWWLVSRRTLLLSRNRNSKVDKGCLVLGVGVERKGVEKKARPPPSWASESLLWLQQGVWGLELSVRRLWGVFLCCYKSESHWPLHTPTRILWALGGIGTIVSGYLINNELTDEWHMGPEFCSVLMSCPKVDYNNDEISFLEKFCQCFQCLPYVEIYVR